MLFMAQVEVRIPHDLDPQRTEELRARELEYALRLQREGRWVHLWRVAGRFANVSVFDVDSNDELHQLLSGLPLYPFMDIRVTPLALHPSSLAAEQRRRDGHEREGSSPGRRGEAAPSV